MTSSLKLQPKMISYCCSFGICGSEFKTKYASKFQRIVFVTPRQLLKKLSVSIQLRDGGEHTHTHIEKKTSNKRENGRIESFSKHRYVHTNAKENVRRTKKECRKLESFWFRHSGSPKWMQLNWKFSNLSEWEKRQFESYHKQSRLQLWLKCESEEEEEEEKEERRREMEKKENYNSMHFCKVLFLHTSPFCTSEVQFFFLGLLLHSSKSS